MHRRTSHCEYCNKKSTRLITMCVDARSVNEANINELHFYIRRKDGNQADTNSRDIVNFIVACDESIWRSLNKKIITAVKNYRAVLLKAQ